MWWWKIIFKNRKKCKKVFAVDISKNAFSKTRSIAPRNLVFLKMNIEHLKFRKNYFDKIICVETLEHVLHPYKVLKEFARVLKPNGKLILTYPTVDQIIVAKIEKFLRVRELGPISEHMTEWDYDDVIKKVEKRGFRFLESRGIVFDFGNLSKVRNISKKITKFFIKIQTSIRIFPRNSAFVAFAFLKNKLVVFS